jgi:hypothetical protein
LLGIVVNSTNVLSLKILPMFEISYTLDVSTPEVAKEGICKFADLVSGNKVPGYNYKIPRDYRAWKKFWSP